MLYNIFISPGHGGDDPGAIGVGVYEKDVNLSVSQALHKMLLENGNFAISMARKTDQTVPLSQRVIMENKENYDLCICIHHNAVNGKASGAEVIHSINGGSGKRLAELVGEEFKKNGQSLRRVFSEESNVYKGKDKYYMIRYTKAPCIITEYCFIDNEKDVQLVIDEAKREFEARAIYIAVCRYFDLPVSEETDYKSLYEQEKLQKEILEGKLNLLYKALSDIITTIRI